MRYLIECDCKSQTPFDTVRANGWKCPHCGRRLAEAPDPLAIATAESLGIRLPATVTPDELGAAVNASYEARTGAAAGDGRDALEKARLGLKLVTADDLIIELYQRKPTDYFVQYACMLLDSSGEDFLLLHWSDGKWGWWNPAYQDAGAKAIAWQFLEDAEQPRVAPLSR